MEQQKGDLGYYRRRDLGKIQKWNSKKVISAQIAARQRENERSPEAFISPLLRRDLSRNDIFC